MQKENQPHAGLIILDIGGTLAKLCIFTNQPFSGPCQQKLNIHLGPHNYYFTFFKSAEECWEYLQAHFHAGDSFGKIVITGGGAFKYEAKLAQIGKQLDKQVQVVEEFESLVKGLTFFKTHLQIEEFVVASISHQTKQTIRIPTSYNELMHQPILVVNIGSGVSMLLIKENQEGELKAERVGGTSLGGGFFLGLANLLVGQNNFKKLLEMAEKGSSNSIDYIPSDFPSISNQLSEAEVLVSLGKLKPESSRQDIVRSLFYMVTFNIAQQALKMSDLYEANNVIFTGFYCRGNQFFLQCFASTFNFYGKGSNKKQVYSMRHDGFLGTLGALEFCQGRGR